MAHLGGPSQDFQEPATCNNSWFVFWGDFSNNCGAIMGQLKRSFSGFPGATNIHTPSHGMSFGNHMSGPPCPFSLHCGGFIGPGCTSCLDQHGFTFVRPEKSPSWESPIVLELPPSSGTPKTIHPKPHPKYSPPKPKCPQPNLRYANVVVNAYLV